MIAQDITNEGDELAQVQAYYQRRADMLTEMRAQELLTEQAHSAAIVANEQAKADALLRIRETEREREMSAQMQSVQAMGQVTGQLLQLLKQAGKERTAIAKAAFLAERAFAVAGIIINTELAASRAGAELGVFGLPLAQTIRATGYASAGLVAGMALGEAFGGGRQYGGPVSAGSLYRINETGEPEMFVGRGGKQYMLPTQGGQVVPADQLGGGGVHVNVHNYSGHPVEVRPAANGRDVEVIVGQAVAEVARQFRQNEGPAWSALTSSSTTRARL
jgi:hypothetical protein